MRPPTKEEEHKNDSKEGKDDDTRQPTGSTDVGERGSRHEREGRLYFQTLLLLLSPPAAWWIVLFLAISVGYWWRESNMDSMTSTACPVFVVTPDSPGLQLDARIFQHYYGSTTVLLRDPPPPTDDDGSCAIWIFLEVTPNYGGKDVHEAWKQLVPPQGVRIWVMVNTEFFDDSILSYPSLELVLCKTRQCVEWVQSARTRIDNSNQRSKAHILYTGFTSFDPTTEMGDSQDDGEPSSTTVQQQPQNDRYHHFLHVAGRSPHKGTTGVLEAWLLHPDWPTLTLTSYDNASVENLLHQLEQIGIPKLPSNIVHYRHRLSRMELTRLQANHGVHLCTSGMEGFGHYINEARAVAALIISTDYPAMNEFFVVRDDDDQEQQTAAILVKPTKLLHWNNGLPYAEVNSKGVTSAVTMVLGMPLEKCAAMGARARKAFEKDQSEFAENMQQLRCLTDGTECWDVTSLEACAVKCGLKLE